MKTISHRRAGHPTVAAAATCLATVLLLSACDSTPPAEPVVGSMETGISVLSLPESVVAAATNTLALPKSERAPAYLITGGGAVVREDFGGVREIYSFTARKDAAGNVGGQLEIHSPADETNIHVRITCIRVDGNRAILAGEVTRITGSNPNTAIWYPGREMIFGVEDNGPNQDRITTFFFSCRPTTPCGTNCGDFLEPIFDSIGTVEWDNGNVTIHGD